jgi:hypothetical protein
VLPAVSVSISTDWCSLLTTCSTILAGSSCDSFGQCADTSWTLTAAVVAQFSDNNLCCPPGWIAQQPADKLKKGSCRPPADTSNTFCTPKEVAPAAASPAPAPSAPPPASSLDPLGQSSVPPAQSSAVQLLHHNPRPELHQHWQSFLVRRLLLS